MTNSQILRAAGAVTTTDITAGGILTPEQAQRFIQETFEKTVLGPLVRHEQRRSPRGEMDKIGIDKRILRAKTEDKDDGYRVKPKHSKLEYVTTPVRLPWEITEETLRQNIEVQNYEAIVTNLMTTQLGLDREDLLLNGDTEAPEQIQDPAHPDEPDQKIDNPDLDFLKINDGWYKLAKQNGLTVDRAAINEGAMDISVFYDAVTKLPNKYNDGSLRWLMSPRRAMLWEQYLLNEMITAGGAINDSLMRSPAGIPIVRVPSMPDDSIMLTNPKNLIAVDTYNVIIRKTTEGKEAVMQDKRFYVVHFDMDAVIEEYDAVCLTYGLK